jgi:hypothetical protein
LHLKSKLKRSAAKKAKLTPAPANNQGTLKHVGGSLSVDWNIRIVNDTWEALWRKHSDKETQDQQFSAVMAALSGIAPKDELEGMMAAQLIAAHSAAMECYRRAMIGEQTCRREELSQANKLSRTFAVLLDALNRHRGKGMQKVVVEHVHVSSGGQAVVGVVETPANPSEGQHIAKQIAHAPQSALRSPNTEREPVPVASNAERPVPDARRKLSGRSKR